MKRSLIALLALVLVTSACSSDKKDMSGGNPQNPTGTFPPPPPPGGTPIEPTYNSGSTADLTIVSNAVLEQYTGRVPNNPSNFKINVDMTHVSGTSPKQYGGSVKISYRETNSSGQYVYYQGHFISGGSTYDTRYNKHITSGSQNGWFKSFFEDLMGGLIIVVDQVNVIDEDLTYWSGRVYFKNFQCGRNPWDPPCNWERPKRCWNISIGPYDCAAFKSGGLNGDGSWKINTAIRQYPEGYTLLGTFNNLEKNEALNE